jgi:hypothetical protein
VRPVSRYNSLGLTREAIKPLAFAHQLTTEDSNGQSAVGAFVPVHPTPENREMFAHRAQCIK